MKHDEPVRTHGFKGASSVRSAVVVLVVASLVSFVVMYVVCELVVQILLWWEGR